MQYKVSPTRVLLTVVSDDDEGQDKSDAAIATTTGGDDDSSSGPGIIVKTAYLGGVVGFPHPAVCSSSEEGEEDFVLPTRSKLVKNDIIHI